MKEKGIWDFVGHRPACQAWFKTAASELIKSITSYSISLRASQISSKALAQKFNPLTPRSD